jgi:hypothetical protein
VPDTDDTASTDDEKPKIDLRASLGESGHEVEDLGYEDVADTGKVLEQDEDSNLSVEDEVARDIATKFPAD